MIWSTLNCASRPSSRGVSRLRKALASRRPLSGTNNALAWCDDDFMQPRNEALVDLEDAVLSYGGSSSNSSFGPWNFTILPATFGGHAVLGANGQGKSLLSNALTSHGSPDILKQGSFYTTDQGWHSNAVAQVSFESHQLLLDKGGTTYKAISGGGNLSKAAQFLIVRFGLYPMLHRDVNTLSTGEIRKVMLVRALANRPRLLVLDNAFDGLDVPSRQKLKDIVSRTIQGFRPDILVQGVSANATAHTQVMLITHREEEIVDEIETLTMWDDDGMLKTMPRNGQNSQRLMAKALAMDDDSQSIVRGDPWENSDLPSTDEIAACWNRDKRSPLNTSDAIVQATNLTVKRGEATLIDDLSWTVRPGSRWLVAGGNGAGKSTLSRLLARVEEGVIHGALSVAGDSFSGDMRRSNVGWVSTELHMATSRSSLTVRQVLEGNTGSSPGVSAAVASWLQLDDPTLLSRSFSDLSQGQQKLVLIGAAIASRPDVLVVDEPCQGLDTMNRHRVLGLLECLCQATDLSLIYVTHHLEELLPSVTDVLHMVDGKAVYTGDRAEYDPDLYSNNEDGVHTPIIER